MNLNDVTSSGPRRKRPRRVGRGPGTGHGKTAGRGMRGYKCRSGSSVPLTYEGGQMPLFRRIPKRGFNNKRFAARCQVVNLRDLGRFEEGAEVGPEELAKARLIEDAGAPVKILGDGRLTKKLVVTAHKFSKSAAEAISAAGGEARTAGTAPK